MFNAPDRTDNNLDIIQVDKRLNKLKIKLPDNWTQMDNPEGPPTFIDESLDEPGVLQISFAEFIEGAKPNPTKLDLINLSETLGNNSNFGSITTKESGDCVYGTFGRVNFTSDDYPLISVWHISNGENFVFATFICSSKPNEKQLNDVSRILMTIDKKKSMFNWF